MSDEKPLQWVIGDSHPKETQGIRIMNKREILEQELDLLLTKYLSSSWIKMKDVLRGMKGDLINKGYVDRKSFRSVLGLLRKEKRFIHLNEKQISEYFSPLFIPESKSSTNLEAFM
jgi:hypothetical protein